MKCPFTHRLPESCVNTPADHDYHHPATKPDEHTLLMEAQEEITRLQAGNETLMKRSSLLFKLTNDDSTVRFYTGFPSYLLLINIFQVIYPTALTMKSYQQYQRFNTGKTQSSRPSAFFNSSSISLIGQFLLTLKRCSLAHWTRS